MDQPDELSVASALKSLFLLGAIDSKRALTSLGQEIAVFPLEPHLARTIVASQEFGCTKEVLDIVAILASSSKLYVDAIDDREASQVVRSKFRHLTGDHMSILNVVRAYEVISVSESKSGRRNWCRQHFLNERCLTEAADIRGQLRTTCKRTGIDYESSCLDNDEPILHSFFLGLTQNSALLQPDGSYKQVIGHSVCVDARCAIYIRSPHATSRSLKSILHPSLATKKSLH